MATSTVAQNPFDPQPVKVTNPGIIGGAITNVSQGAGVNDVAAPTKYNPLSGLNIQQYTAQQRNVDPTTETAAGQLDSILAQDSPLMKRARTIASQNMNQRGLVNSSMAQGAGVAAMIDRATPIAQQDAETYSNRALANMGAVNTANQFNVGQSNALFGQGLGIAADYAKQIQGQEFQTSERTAAQKFTEAQTALERAQQIALADKSIAAQQNLQQAQQDFDATQANLNRQQQTSERVASQSFQSGESALERQQQTSLQTAQQTFTAAQAALDRAQQTALTDKSITAQANLQKAQQEFQTAQADLDRAQQTALQKSQQQFTAAESVLDRSQQQVLQKAQQDFQTTQSALDRATQVSLAEKSIAAQEALQKATQTFQETQNKLDRTHQETLAKAQQTFQSAEAALDRAQQITLTDKSITAQKNLQDAQQTFQTTQAALDRTQQGIIADKQIAAQQALASAQQAFQATQASLDRASARSVAEFQNNLQKSNAADTFKANVSLNTLNAINAIALDPNLDATAKTTAITNVTSAQSSALTYGSTLYQTTATATPPAMNEVRSSIESVLQAPFEQQAALYRDLRSDGVSDASIRTIVEDKLGAQTDSNWSAFTSSTGYVG